MKIIYEGGHIDGQGALGNPTIVDEDGSVVAIFTFHATRTFEEADRDAKRCLSALASNKQHPENQYHERN